MRTQRLISDYFVNAKIALNVPDVAHPSGIHETAYWIKLRKERALDFRKFDFMSNPFFVNGSDDKFLASAAVSIVPCNKQTITSKLLERLCISCRIFVLLSKFEHHCGTVGHARCFFEECYRVGIFKMLHISAHDSEIIPHRENEHVCTVLSFFTAFEKHFSIDSDSPFSCGGYSQLFHGVEVATNMNVALKMFNCYSSPSDVMNEYTTLKTFGYFYRRNSNIII